MIMMMIMTMTVIAGSHFRRKQTTSVDSKTIDPPPQVRSAIPCPHHVRYYDRHLRSANRSHILGPPSQARYPIGPLLGLSLYVRNSTTLQVRHPTFATVGQSALVCHPRSATTSYSPCQVRHSRSPPQVARIGSPSQFLPLVRHIRCATPGPLLRVRHPSCAQGRI